MTPTWPDEKIEQLRALYNEKYSMAKIASAMGITRNAVIGKLHREGLFRGRAVGRRGPSRTAHKAKAPRKLRPHIEAHRVVGNRVLSVLEFDDAPLRAADVIPFNIALQDLQSHHCRYPTSDAPTLFCGCKKFGEASYCLPHYELTHKAREVKTGRHVRLSVVSMVGAWV
jgi:hypothetical protein